MKIIKSSDEHMIKQIKPVEKEEDWGDRERERECVRLCLKEREREKGRQQVFFIVCARA